jgi:hypothetical protein
MKKEVDCCNKYGRCLTVSRDQARDDDTIGNAVPKDVLGQGSCARARAIREFAKAVDTDLKERRIGSDALVDSIVIW